MKNKRTVVLAIANQKGGVGKSTTAAAIAAGLCGKGYKVLSIDLDGQCNLTLTLLQQPPAQSIYNVLTDGTPATAVICPTADTGDIIAASQLLQGSDKYLTQPDALKRAIEPLNGVYDFILLDTPPALGMLTINAFTAAHKVIIPAGADAYSLQGIQALYDTVQTVRAHTNPELAIAGIVLTRYSSRSILSRDLAEAIAETAKSIGTVVFNARIREAIAVKEAQAVQRSLLLYAPNSKPAQDYKALLDEILRTLKRKG